MRLYVHPCNYLATLLTPAPGPCITVIYGPRISLTELPREAAHYRKVRLMNKIYTAQTNKFGNVIVCGDEVERKSYRIIFTGTYPECMAIKYAGVKVGA